MPYYRYVTVRKYTSVDSASQKAVDAQNVAPVTAIVCQRTLTRSRRLLSPHTETPAHKASTPQQNNN